MRPISSFKTIDEYLDSKQIKGSQACDQCNIRRARCNKKKPRCSSCQEKRMACSWNRQLKYHPSLSYQNIETFSVGLPQRQSKSRRNCKIEENSLNISDYTIKTISSSYWLPVIKKWFSYSYNRHIFYYLMKSADVDYFRATRRDKRFLSDILVHRINLLQPNQSKNIMISVDDKQVINLLVKATQTYFDTCHSTYPIFYHSNNFLPRSSFLKVTIWYVGLQFLSRSLLQQTMTTLCQRLLNWYLLPSNMKWSLDYLQGYLVILTGLVPSRIYMSQNVLFHMAVTIATGIGIHMKFKTHPEYLMSFNVLRYLDFERVYMWGYCPITPRDHFKSNLKNYLSNQLVNTNDLNILCNFHLGEEANISLDSNRNLSKIKHKRTIIFHPDKKLSSLRKLYLKGTYQLDIWNNNLTRPIRNSGPNHCSRIDSTDSTNGPYSIDDFNVRYPKLNDSNATLRHLDLLTYVLAIRYHFAQLLYDSLLPCHTSLAINLITLLSRKNHHHISLHQPTMLLTAAKLLIKNYHTVSKSVANQSIHALTLVQNWLRSHQNCPISGYFYKANLAILDILLSRYKIVLPA